MSNSKIFFSYSRLDSDFALRLAKDIRAAGIDIWIDQLDIQAGNHWDAAVEKALATSACVLVILTPSSTSSTNVMDEVSFALESGKKIIPVLLEDCLAPFRLRRLQRIDFTKDYQAGFKQLLAAFDFAPAGTNGDDEAPVKVEPIKEVQDPEKKVKTDAETESRLWDAACKLNTVAGYERYLKEMVTGEYKEEAGVLIHQLVLEQKEDEQEAAAWKKAKTEHSLQSYQDYLKAYPNRNYKSLALTAIGEFEALQKEELRKEEAKRQEEKRLDEQRKEEQRIEAKRQEEKKQEEKREEAKRLEEKKKEEKRIEEEKKKEEKRIEEEKKAAKRLEEQRQEEIRKEQKRQETLRKEKEKEEQKKLVAAKSPVPATAQGDSKPSPLKYILMGAGLIAVGLLLYLFFGMKGVNKRDLETWNQAKVSGDSVSYAAYMLQFPKGEFFKDAQLKIDSISNSKKAERDAKAVAAAQSKQDSITKASQPKPSTTSTANTAAGNTGKTPDNKPAPTTSTPPKTKPTATPPKADSPYKLGQTFGGGIIAFIDQSGQHGLIVSEKDLGNLPNDGASKKCSKFTAGDHKDWRLPTKDELTKIYHMRKELGIYTKGTYWSMTPDKDNYVWSLNMNDGVPISFNKTMYLFFRPVRTF